MSVLSFVVDFSSFMSPFESRVACRNVTLTGPHFSRSQSNYLFGPKHSNRGSRNMTIYF